MTIWALSNTFDEEKKKALVQELTDAFARILKVQPEGVSSINILIQEYDPSTDFAVGGRFVGEWEQNHSEE